MLKDIWPDDFQCPQCGKVPKYNSVIGVREYSVRRLDLPYFMCGDCRLCSYSKLLLKQTISRWGNSVKLKGISHSQVYQASKKIVEEVLAYYTRTAGYRLVPYFKRK